MTKIKIYISFLLVAALSGCNLFSVKKNHGKTLARAYQSYLYQADLTDVVPKGLSKEDSTLFVENYIYNWGKQQLILQKAAYNLTVEDQNFNALVEQYRNDLIKFTYQEKYVNKNLDTTISEEEIKSYYKEFPQNFELKENILKVDYIIFDSDIPELEKAKKWFYSSKESNQEKFHEFAKQYAVVYMYSDTNWVPFEEMAKTIPVKTYNQQEFLIKNKNVLIEDSLNTYYLRIKAFKIKEDVSPLAYVRFTIKSIILNKRKLDLILKMENDIYEDAYEKKDFEVY